MRTFFPLLAIGLAMLTGCTTLFIADFEDDTNFQQPDLTPPGPPANDEIVLLGDTDAVYEVTPSALDGTKSFRMEAQPNGTARARMDADGIGDPDKPIVISFTGRLVAGSHGMINISAGGSQFAVYISLNEGLITVNGRSAGQYTEGGQHNMLLAMFPASDTFELIFTGAVLFGDAISGPLNNPGGLPGSSYALQFELDPMPDGGVYIVDNPRIRSRNF